MTLAWVLGSRGLLGSALSRVLRDNGAKLFSPDESFCWDNAPALATQIANATRTFAAAVDPADNWEIYWAAGLGTMSSPAEAFAPETHALSLLLEHLVSNKKLATTSGAIAFASSAGAIYAGATQDIITEDSPPAPTTDYARKKLEQEELVSGFVNQSSTMTALIARISTLYGPGQATGKKQGLMTHIARSILRNQPVQIYVPYDTIRDYISADDAASAIVNSLRYASKKRGVVTKIIASEHPATIAEIVSIFKRVARRKPRIVTSASKLSGLYSRRVQFRSVVLRENRMPPPQQLAIGIAQLMQAEREVFILGSRNKAK